MSRLHPRLLVECKPERIMFTKEGYCKYVVPRAWARRVLSMSDHLVLPEQLILSQPVPIPPVPVNESMSPRNRHERRREAARQRRTL